ncbi:MAG: UbiA-like polyprenyltransferase [Acidobacteriota bacterium]
MAGGLAAWRNRLVLTGELVAFPHTIFALPFAFLGMILGSGGRPTPGQVVWITLAMIGARTAAMSFNRIVDRRLDAANPRTCGRPLPSGRIGLGWAVAVCLLACGLFFVAAAALSPLCLALAPLALLIVLGYSYTKRFTWAGHLILGLALAGAPVGAWIAVSGPLSAVPALLALAVICWTAGFDIIYSCQDQAFDRERGLESIPARFGIGPALRISSWLHALMMVALGLAAPLAGLGGAYLAGLFLVGLVLVHEHRIVGPRDLSRVNAAFFTLNGWVSVIIFAAALVDLRL